MAIAGSQFGKRNAERPLVGGTLADVAALAGVSRSTASRALSSNGYASSEALARVMEAAEALGYRPNYVARNLRERRTRTVGLIVEDIQNSFYAQVARGVEEAARQRGHQTVLVNTDGDLEQEAAALTLLQETRIDGIIVTPANVASADLYKPLAEGLLPVVQVDVEAYRGSHSISVVGDNVGAAQQATRHLLENGHRSIVLLVDRPGLLSIEQRIAGHREALREHGAPFQESLIRRFPARGSARQRIVDELVLRPLKFTAAIATTNTVAAEFIQAMFELGLRCPDDVSLVSLDDAPWMSFFPTPVSAIHQPAVEMGKLAADLLLDCLAGQKVESPMRHTVESQLVHRSSVRCIV